MTIKEKFSSIDQSKLTADQKSFLDKIKNVTKNFSDAEMNKKVETPLDNFIAKAKEKMPEAIKSAPVKRTSKAKPSQTRKPKRTAMSLAKEIRKEGESWSDARARASKMMKEDSKDLSKTVETELDKLSKLVKNAKTRSKLVGISGTDIKRDAVRKAKPRGARRVTHSGETSNQYGTFSNKLGRKYYESRDRHSDRLAPRYPKNAPLLENGAYLTDGNFGNFQNQVYAEGGDIDAFTLRMVKSNGMQPAEVLKEDTNVRYSKGGATTNERKHVNHDEDYEVRYAKPRPSRTGYKGVRGFAGGGSMNDKEFSLADAIAYIKDAKKDKMTFYYNVYGGDDYFTLQPTFATPTGNLQGFPRKVTITKEGNISGRKLTYALGGTVVTDLAGHTGAGSGGLDAGMPLDGFSNTGYSGLVGETGAMSSGEMFMAGGSVNDKEYKPYVFYFYYDENEMTFDTLEKALLEAKRLGVMKVRDNLGGEYFINYANGGSLPSGSEQSYMVTEALGNPAQHFKLGGKLEGKEKQINMLFKNQGIREAIQKEQADAIRSIIEKDGISTKGISDKEMVMIARELSKEDYARGGGVRKVGNREYSYGRNWTNDHRHVNKDEEHEVKYNRKGKFLGVFEGGGDIDSKNITMAKRTNVKKWYTKTYPTDDLGEEIRENITFWSVWTMMSQGYNVYDVLDVSDSLVRERVFQELSKILKIDYDIIYKLWLNSDDYANGGGVDYYEQLGVYVQGVGSIYKGISMEKAVEIANSYNKKNPNAEIVIVDEKYGDEYDMDGNLKDEYAKGGALTNERKHVNHDEDYEVRYAKPRPSRKGYKGVRNFAKGGGVENKYNSMSKEDKEELMREKIGIGRTPFSEYEKYNQLSNYHKEEVNKHFNSKKFMAGGSMETPRIYVADLEAYNSGRLVGEWLDLADYNNADELMDAIQDVLKKSGGEEYAIHDVEYIPRSIYSEYMGKRDFEQLYEMMDLAKQNDLPLEVVEDIVSQYSANAVEDFVGKYDSAVDFAEELVDDLGIQSFTDFEYYLDISETDRRLLSQEMADSYVDDIRDEDGGNRLIQEAGLDVEEYEEADSSTQEQMLENAREIVYDEYYNNWYDGLSDPYYFLVEEQGMYSAEDFANANFVRVDYEKLADDLEQDYTMIEYDGEVYVFNIR